MLVGNEFKDSDQPSPRRLQKLERTSEISEGTRAGKVIVMSFPFSAESL